MYGYPSRLPKSPFDKNTMSSRTFTAIFMVWCLSCLMITGCKTAQSTADYQLAEAPVRFTEMTDSLPPDPAIEALVAPYRDRLQEKIDEVIGEATGLLEKKSPEGTLGNMAADALLYSVNQMVDTPVDMALTNNGGLRVPINPGPITVGKIFELMPFENMTIVLEMDPVQMDSLAQQIARAFGEPIAGFSFTIDAAARTAHNLLINGSVPEEGRIYRLATSDYLANGGGRLPALWDARGRQELNLLLRDAFIQYIRDKGSIEPMIDGRISSNQ